jgi:leucyl/phenylalanyl-tRNA--protein transferase
MREGGIRTVRIQHSLREGGMPAEPEPTDWSFPPVSSADEHGIVGVGADLEPGTVLMAYRHGIFPMPLHRGGLMGWWSPDPRAVIPLDGLRVSRSLRRSCARHEVRVDTSFTAVLDACADRRRPHGWISPAIRAAYIRLHELGWAHSVEAWSLEDGGLAGGLYGIAIGGLFAGESMVHHGRDASKVALVGLVDRLREDGAPGRLLDVQWLTEHLSSLGAVEVSRTDYGRLLADAIAIDVTW